MLGISGPGPPPPPPIITSHQSMVPGPSNISLLGGQQHHQQSNAYCVTNHLGPANNISSNDTLLLQLRSKPHSRVFRALFQYLPMRDSPNENPQLELSLQPGDVVLVKGEMDSDGFYRGETLDGRNGLVPSNYVERVPDSVLLANTRAPSPSFPLRIPQHLSTIQHDFSSPDHSTLPDSVCPYPPADVTKVTVQEIKNNETPRVPCPRELIVEKKLSRSALVSWSPPEESFVAVSQYHVCVDSSVRAIVPGSYKCRALVEDIPLDGSVNLSVRAVTENGHSPDACCTIAIGNEAAVAPQQVRVWAVTPVSACVRWYPSNSNAEHVVSLNAVKVGVCPPTVFQVQLQGLQPSTIYRVSVRTKHPKAVLEQRPVERCIDFKTLPKIGLPDPPSCVQVEIGPQPGTLLVSWQPISNQPKPPSRAAVHSYLIYADGKNIAQVPSSTADHVVLRLADLSDDPPIFITVRTKTKEGAVSSDSNVARVPRTSGLVSTSSHQQSYHSHLHQQQEQFGTTSAPPTNPPIHQDMTSSYPSYNPVTANSAAMFVAPSSLTNGHSAVSHPQPTVPSYNSQNRLIGATGIMAYQQPSYSNVAHATVGGGIAPQLISQQSAPIPSSNYATFDRSASLGAQPSSNVPIHNSVLIGGPTSRPSPSNAWKTNSQSMSQYYTFHPNFLHTEPTSNEDVRPSVLEMENSYLMRHRQSDWTNAPESRDARARIEAYSRGLARAGSADERVHHGISAGPQTGTLTRRLIAPRLARVKSESGFGTRSEPDLRPPTLDQDQDCRWFVALFDYSHHMSPNANAEFEELPFRKHQLIKVYGEADADGFYQGQIGNRIGLVPSNMVIEIAKDDVFPRRSIAGGGMPAQPPLPCEPALRRMRWGSLKSRSYDYAGDQRRQGGHHPNYASLDRRGDRERDREREYRRGESRDRGSGYRDDYRDQYDTVRRDRDRERIRRHEDVEEEEYRRRYETRRDRERDRDRDREYRRVADDERRYPGPQDRRYPEGESTRRNQDYYDYPPSTQGPGQGSQVAQQLNHQMQQMHISQQQQPLQQQMQPMQPQMQQQPMQQIIGIPSSSGIGGMGGGGTDPMSMYNQVPSTMQQQNVATKKMVAKFDYDSRQLSPNVDAEQVELSFRQGDIIIVFGEMDEDGFYMGELNGVRGLVPSNFLQSSPLNTLGPSQPMEPMGMGIQQQQQRKGVAFSDTSQVVRKSAPVRQTSQTSASMGGGGGASVSAGASTKPAAKKSTAGQSAAGKPLAKKTSDVGKSAAPNARKTSTAVKKSDSSAKKK